MDQIQIGVMWGQILGLKVKFKKKLVNSICHSYNLILMALGENICLNDISSKLGQQGSKTKSQGQNQENKLLNTLEHLITI